MRRSGMELSKEYPIRRFEAGRSAAQADPVVTETRIELDVNEGQLRLAMLCLPHDLKALAVGFLMGEGALRSVEDLDAVDALPDEHKVIVRGDLDADALENINLRWTWGSACGGGGTSRDMDNPAYAPVGAGRPISPGRLLALAVEFSRKTSLWRQTGGVHGCALADETGLYLFAEDVGRHNAFDKVMGMAALAGIDPTDKVVITTGRLSAEIVSKAAACRVPILASRLAVTSLAIQLARRFGLTLVGFLRGKRLSVYTGYERIRGNEDTPSATE